MDGQGVQNTNQVVEGTATNNAGTVTQPVGGQNQTEVPVTQPGGKTEVNNQGQGSQEPKTFTQEEVNAMLAKEKKNLPTKEDLKAFNDWKEAQKTEEQKRQEELVKAQKVQQENEAKGQMLEIMKKGVDFEKAEFIQFKLSKMDGDFTENLENYLKDHPIVDAQKETKPATTGFAQNRVTTVTNPNKEYLDKKYANNPYYKK